MRITCIDFETANPFIGSVCAMGIAVIEDGKIVMSKNIPVKPHPKYGVFNKDNVRIHGITKESVKEAPEFNEVYASIKQYIEDSMVAAHNSDFDIRALKDVMTVYEIPIPAFDYFCTVELAKSTWLGLKNYRLHTVSAHLNHVLKHHDAGEDALACATIITSAFKETGISDIRALLEHAKVKIKSVKPGEAHVLSHDFLSERTGEKVNAAHIMPATESFDPGHPMYKKEFVFTGEFSTGLTRREAMQKVVDSGGTVSNWVRGATDYLVTAPHDQRKKPITKESGKVIRAKRLIEGKRPIQIIDENTFFSMMNFKV
jgi:DNA polymerase-3 subunit epsilon